LKAAQELYKVLPKKGRSPNPVEMPSPVLEKVVRNSRIVGYKRKSPSPPLYKTTLKHDGTLSKLDPAVFGVLTNQKIKLKP
jgi:hypothetical protein